MPVELVDNEWFIAEFPSAVKTSVIPDGELATTTELTASDALGSFTIRAIEIAIDPFVAVGPRGWVDTFGTGILQKYASYEAQVVDDQVDEKLGGAVRQLVLRIEQDGPCGVFCRIFAHPNGDRGRVLECTALVEIGKEGQKSAFRFLNSVQAKWSPTR